MKTSIKDIVIGAFAVIGFYVVVTGFNSPQAEPQVISATPESHQWEMKIRESSPVYFLFNKATGEVRYYEIINTASERKAIRDGEGNEIIYRSAAEVKQSVDY